MAISPVILIVAAIALVAAVAPKFVVTPVQPTALAQPGAPVKGITVVGTGRVTAKPDMATIRLGARTQAETAQQAQQANAEQMDAVVRSIKGLEIPDKDIQTSGISLHEIYGDERAGTQGRIVGYEASNVVTVHVKDLSKVGAVLDEAVRAGANVAGGIQFGLQDDSQQRKEALKMAIQGAQGKAEAIALAMDRTVTGVESVPEETVSPPVPVYGLREMAQAATPPTPIEPGELEIAANVRVVYGF